MRQGRKDFKELSAIRADLRLPLRASEAPNTEAPLWDKSPFRLTSVKESRVKDIAGRDSQTPSQRPYVQQKSSSVYQHAKNLTTLLGPHFSSSTYQSDSIAGSVEIIVSELENADDESLDLSTAREVRLSQPSAEVPEAEVSDTELVIRQFIADRDRTLAKTETKPPTSDDAPDLSAFISEIKASQAQAEQEKHKDRWLLKQQVLKLIGQPSGLVHSDPSDSENSMIRARKDTAFKAHDRVGASRSKSLSKNKASVDLLESQDRGSHAAGNIGISKIKQTFNSAYNCLAGKPITRSRS